MMALERTYNVPLRKRYINTPRHRRAKKASAVLRQFLQKHMKADEVKIGQHLNHEIWKHGMKNPPHHVKVKAVKEDGVVKAELEGFDYKETVRPEEFSEPEGLAQKLAGKMGVKEVKAESETKTKEAKTEDKEAKEKPPRSSVESMTKAEIEKLGKEHGIELTTNDTKKEMIDKFFN